jgi:predicted DNA-binding protein (MmcQ/YjbR family)
MNIEQVRDYCISKPFTQESFPFDDVTLVFKVAGKMFALLPLDEIDNPSINLKGSPEDNIQYREKFTGIEPGFHMNKKHWNTVRLESDVDRNLIKKMINRSYDLVVKSLSKKLKDQLRSL